MNTPTVIQQKQLSANEQFKQQYPKVLRWSTAIAVFLAILIFLLSPNYVPHPYQLRQSEFEVVDIPEQEDLVAPPPPTEAPPPPQVIEAAPDDEVADDVEVADTLMDLDTALTTGGTDWVPSGDEGFVASSENPRILEWAKPFYPEMARRAQIEGTVMVKVLVGPDGLVKDAIILRGVNPLIDKEALAAARRCKFSPGKQRNIPVKAWMALPFAFKLN